MTREHVHLIGIGGTGMTALAGLLHESGCRVTGTDGALYPPTSTLLASMGLDFREGFDAAHLRPAPDMVVVGNAVSRGNPEVEEVLDRNLRHDSMPRVIHDRFLGDRHSIVVAGTHGKTTTTSMVAWILSHAGRDPGFLIGGLPLNFERPFRLGAGEAFVIEGDEYDTAFFDKGPKFMHYRPDTALIGTVEFDHADIYRDIDEITRVFRRLVNLVPRRGLLVQNADCELTRDVTSKAFSRVQGYGLEQGEWRAVDFRDLEDGACFRVTQGGEDFAEIRLTTGGEHNVQNALAAIAATREQGLSAEEIAAGLATFTGVKRRLERVGEVDDVIVYDDFAHHPTAVAHTLATVRRRHPRQRIRAVLEPRSWSLRRNVFQDRLSAAFDGADEVLLARVFRAEAIPEAERLDTDRLVADLEARGLRARAFDGADAILAQLLRDIEPGDVVIVMSNGGFGGLQGRLVDGLRTRAEAANRAAARRPAV